MKQIRWISRASLEKVNPQKLYTVYFLVHDVFSLAKLKKRDITHKYKYLFPESAAKKKKKKGTILVA